MPALKTEVVDTVGAGDTLQRRCSGKNVRARALHKDALRRLTPEVPSKNIGPMGAQVAAVTVSRAGANPPWIAEMRQGPQ